MLFSTRKINLRVYLCSNSFVFILNVAESCRSIEIIIQKSWMDQQNLNPDGDKGPSTANLSSPSSLRTERGETVFNEIDEDSGFFLLLLCDAQESYTSHEQLELKEPFVAPFFPLPLLFWLRINDHPFRIIRDRCGRVVTR